MQTLGGSTFQALVSRCKGPKVEQLDVLEQQRGQYGWNDKGVRNGGKAGGVLPGAVIGGVLCNGAPVLKGVCVVLYIHIWIYIYMLTSIYK